MALRCLPRWKDTGVGPGAGEPLPRAGVTPSPNAWEVTRKKPRDGPRGGGCSSSSEVANTPGAASMPSTPWT